MGGGGGVGGGGEKADWLRLKMMIANKEEGVKMTGHTRPKALSFPPLPQPQYSATDSCIRPTQTNLTKGD